MTSDKTYCLVIAANPYHEVAIAECDATGRPITAQRYRKYGDQVDLSSGLRKPIKSAGTKTVTDVFFVRSLGGTFPAPWVQVLDSTPRSFADAERLALRFPRGSHVDPVLTLDRAKEMLASMHATA